MVEQGAKRSSVETPSGLVIVDKPAGITSHDVVSRVRRLAGTRKVGHAGTLDPLATGVLVLGVERATRLLGHLMLTEKSYEATVRLGAVTTTDDAEGETVATTPVRLVEQTAEHSSVEAIRLTEGAIRSAFATQVGEIEQVPTAVSAIKVDGKRAYQRVRDGEEVRLKARPVTVHELTVHSVVEVDGFVDVEISVRCSSGTYIRAIARDVGDLLGVGGHLTALRRTAVGPYGLDVARTLDQLADGFTTLPLADAARAAFPSLELTEAEAIDVRYGRGLDRALDGLTALFAPTGEFLALHEPGQDGRTRPTAVFV